MKLKIKNMEIYKKIAQVKAEIGTLKKNAKNLYFENTYIDLGGLLDTVEPLLEKNGLILLQPITGGNVITQIIDIDTSEAIYSQIELPTNQSPQQLGSAITYYRRYTLQSLLGLSAEDDDGQSASKKELPTLDLKGFNFLIEKGSQEQIKTALNERKMTTEQKETLTKLIK